MIEPLLVALCGCLDRVRGDSFDFASRAVDKGLYGWLMAALLGHPLDLFTGPIIAAMYLGASPGWGNAIGPALQGVTPFKHAAEWWQVGPLIENAWLSLIARGAIWGIPFLPLAYWDPRFVLMVPIFAIAMPLACLAAKKLDNSWEWQEYFRGWLAGGLAWCGTFF